MKGVSISKVAVGGIHGPEICPEGRCAHSTRDARISIMHSVNHREAPEVLAHSSDGASVPELGEAMSGHEPRKLKVQQLRRLIAHCCRSPQAPPWKP